MENTEIQPQQNNNDDKNILILTIISCLFLGFIVPLIVWIIQKNKMNDAPKKLLVDLLNFELTLLIASIILIAINIIPLLGQFIWGIGSTGVMLVNLIFIIMAIVKISNNEEFKFPLTMTLIK